MIRFEDWTGLGCDTPRLHQKEIIVEQIMVGDQDEELPSTRSK